LPSAVIGLANNRVEPWVDGLDFADRVLDRFRGGNLLVRISSANPVASKDESSVRGAAAASAALPESMMPPARLAAAQPASFKISRRSSCIASCGYHRYSLSPRLSASDITEKFYYLMLA